MESKINSKTRIKLKYLDLKKMREEFEVDGTTDFFTLKLSIEAGLVRTSTKWLDYGSVYEYTYYFKIVDKQKYLLAKIKYGI